MDDSSNVLWAIVLAALYGFMMARENDAQARKLYTLVLVALLITMFLGC